MTMLVYDKSQPNVPPPPTPPRPLSPSLACCPLSFLSTTRTLPKRIASYKPNYTSISHNLDTRLQCRKNQSTTHPHRIGSGSSLTLPESGSLWRVIFQLDLAIALQAQGLEDEENKHKDSKRMRPTS